MNNELFAPPVVCRNGEGDGLVEVLVVPDGRVDSANGVFIVDQEAWAMIEEAFKAHGISLPIDYEHQTLGGKHSSPDGKAPAAGWIEELRYEPGKGIVARVSWTDEGRRLIRADEYRHLSPVLLVQKSDRRAVKLHSVGLTNKPAIPRMEKVAAKESTENTETMDMSEKTKTKRQAHQEGGAPPAAEESPASAEQLLGQIREILATQGVEVDAAAESILAAVIKALKGESDKDAESPDAEVAASVRGALELPADADKATVLKVLADMSGHVGFTPNKEVKALTERLGDLERVEKQRAGAELREKYKMKINPHDRKQMDWAVATSETDPEHFVRMVENAPDALPPQGKTTGPPVKGRRAMVIASARAEHAANPGEAFATLIDFVDGALRDDTLALLSEDEKKKLDTE